MKQLCEIAERLREKIIEACTLCVQAQGNMVSIDIKDQLLTVANEIQSIASEISGQINALENSTISARDEACILTILSKTA